MPTLALTVSGGLLWGQQVKPKFSSELQNADPRSNVDVIVQFDQVPTAAYHQKVLDRGGQLRRTLNLVKAGAYTMPASAIADLANDASVVHISLDHPLGAKLDYTSAAINASTAWQSGWTGTGVGLRSSTAASPRFQTSIRKEPAAAPAPLAPASAPAPVAAPAVAAAW